MLCSKIAGISASSLSFILLLTGILTDYWLVNFGQGLYHEGLWQRCSKNICDKLSSKNGYIEGTRGLLIVSAAFMVLGLVSSCLSFANVYVGKISVSLIASGLESISAVLLIIGMSVYTAENTYIVNNSSFNFNWSFFLSWVSVLGLLIAAVSHILAYKASPRPGYDTVGS
ncbi:lens fiber membrane intrinsic protein [Bombina bombina]|uniref:lens fiber membrane intrinsic protein n=1 Tax=Bombina bombina TaxID=8345 RepID=UPI00235A7102|nr:lens fiber membrane intrinsic protein [Bombina bombina]